MAHASKKNMGVGSHGKFSGSGAMTVLAEDVLSTIWSCLIGTKQERGLDSRQVNRNQIKPKLPMHHWLDLHWAGPAPPPPIADWVPRTQLAVVERPGVEWTDPVP
jgi:hypothetical protein